MIIREAILEDCAAIAKIQVDSYQVNYGSILPEKYLSNFSYEEQQQDWQNLLKSPKDTILYVAEARTREIVGYALGIHNPREIPPFESEFVAIHIRQDVQRCGFGRLLFAEVCISLNAQGNNSMFLWVLAENPACDFYEKLGGKIIAKKPWENNKFFHTNIHEIAYGWEDITIFNKTKN